MKIELREEAINCLKFWQGHDMYGGSLSDVICQQMHEWLCRDMHGSNKDIDAEFDRIKNGAYND